MPQETTKIVRLLRKDLPGELNIERALRELKGISFITAKAIRVKSGLNPNTKLGDLNEQQLSNLSKILENPEKFNIPGWLFNRRKDTTTGIDKHVLESDLMLTQREDVQRMKKIHSYRGMRHIHGLKVRGQRTRSTGRGKVSIGVIKKKKGVTIAPKAKPEEKVEVKKETEKVKEKKEEKPKEKK